MLYTFLGERAALDEVLTEILVGLAVIGGCGGGGRRLREELRRFLAQIRQRRVPALSHSA